jgi:cobalt-zinc-cadmium efflux system outer membrane protein
MFFRTLFPFCALAALAAAEPLTTETAIRLALENHPQLEAARALITEAEARSSGLGRLPNPEMETELALGRQERGRIEIGLSQTFPRASRLRGERHMAHESIRLARHEVAFAELTTAARVRLAVVELAAAQAELALAERQAVLARELARSQSSQVKSGQLSSLDATQAELIAREAELALAVPRAARATAALALSTALGREADATLSVSYDLSLPPEAGAIPPPGPCAEVAITEAKLGSADAELALARLHSREDFRVGVFVEGEQERSEPGEREGEAMLGVRFSVPLPVRNISAPRVAEKQAARRRVALEGEARLLKMRNELAANEAELLARHGFAAAFARELLPAVKAHVAATEAAFARGEIETSLVFRARERLAEIERSDLAARHAYHRAAVRRLSSACCIPL